MKILFPLFGLFLLLSCTGTQEPKSSDSDKPPQKISMALVVKTLTNPFFIEMEKGARKAEKELGFVLKVKSGAQETSIDQQIAIIEALIEEGVKAIVIAPGSSTDLIPVLKKAKDKGIVLVNIDNQLDPEGMKKAGLNGVPFISVDNVQGGYLSAKTLSKVTSPTKAVILEGIREAANANQRKAGAEKAFSENPLITLVDSRSANWKIDEGYSVTKALFTKTPDIGMIFAANDMMALGAIQYLQEKNLKKVKIAAYDALTEARKAIREGWLTATIDQQADLQGYIGCVTAMDLLKNKPVQDLVQVDVKLITKDNVGP